LGNNRLNGGEGRGQKKTSEKKKAQCEKHRNWLHKSPQEKNQGVGPNELGLKRKKINGQDVLWAENEGSTQHKKLKNSGEGGARPLAINATPRKSLRGCHRGRGGQKKVGDKNGGVKRRGEETYRLGGTRRGGEVRKQPRKTRFWEEHHQKGSQKRVCEKGKISKSTHRESMVEMFRRQTKEKYHTSQGIRKLLKGAK